MYRPITNAIDKTNFRAMAICQRLNYKRIEYPVTRVVKKLMRPPDDNISAGHPIVLDNELSGYYTDSNS